MRRRILWGIVFALVVPLLTLSAQRFRRGSPGNDPNPNVDYNGQFTFAEAGKNKRAQSKALHEMLKPAVDTLRAMEGIPDKLKAMLPR